MGAILILWGCSGSSGGDSAAGFPIAGSITGLSAAGLVLQNNGGDGLAVSANTSSFRFTAPVAAGGDYRVAVATQPAGLTCTVSNGSGGNVREEITTVGIACSPVTHAVSGTVAGLVNAGLVLRNNDADDLPISAGATTFQFATSVADGGGYSVIAFAQPDGLICSVGSGTGSNVQAAVGSVHVTCSATGRSIGGTVTGLTGSGLIVQNNGGDNLAVPAHSSTFEFATPVASGGSYAVTVLAQPGGQTCSVTRPSGTATANATDVALTCATIPTYTLTPQSGSNGTIAPGSAVLINSGASQGLVATPNPGYGVDQWLVDGVLAQSGGSVYTLSNITANHTVAVTFGQTTLSLSVSALALSVSGGGALSGVPRLIAVTNTGSLEAQNFTIDYPALPSGTTAASTCGSTLGANQSCTITITPGSAATSGCEAGTAATPGSVSVAADNANTNQASVVVLTYGCTYQGGYLFAVDDTAPNTGSIDGKIAAQTDTPAVAWSSGNLIDVPGSASNVDGAANTVDIVEAQGPGVYAAQVCTAYTTDASGNTPCSTGTCYSGWYLPALCEMSYDNSGEVTECGSAASPGMQNMQSNLVDAGMLGGLAGPHWSSTEFPPDPEIGAWLLIFETDGSSNKTAYYKGGVFGARCARALSQ